MQTKQETIEAIRQSDIKLNNAYVQFISLPDGDYWLRLMDSILDLRLAQMELLRVQIEGEILNQKLEKLNECQS